MGYVCPVVLKLCSMHEYTYNITYLRIACIVLNSNKHACLFNTIISNFVLHLKQMDFKYEYIYIHISINVAAIG